MSSANAHTLPTLAQILATCEYLQLSEKNRIICKLTGHEMPARADIVHKFINGEKFKKALGWYSYDFSQYFPYIIENDKENGKKKLFCTLTKQVLNRIPAEVAKHTNGKRFKRLKGEFESKAKEKEKPSKRASVEDLWVPPGELVGEDEGGGPAPREDDSMSDLIGSDRDSLHDDDDDGDGRGPDQDQEEDQEEEEILVRKKARTASGIPAASGREDRSRGRGSSSSSGGGRGGKQPRRGRTPAAPSPSPSPLL